MPIRVNILYVFGVLLFVFVFSILSIIISPDHGIHPKEYFCSSSGTSLVPTKDLDTAQDVGVDLPSTLPIHKNVAIFMLMPPSRLHQATLALKAIENSFNRRLKYPYVIFMSESELEEVSQEMKDKIDWITERRATFAALRKEDWDVPEGLDPERIEESLRKIGFSRNYRSMCRFNSGLFYRHPALAKYDWLWRLDTDIEFHCDVPYDPIQRLIDANALYGFIQISGDADSVQPSLASNVSEFLASHKHLVPAKANHGFAWHNPQSIQKALEGKAVTDDWTRQVMYNNFEISHRRVWESEIYGQFFKFLDDAGGFFYERWGDAPVHSFGLAMSLQKHQVLQFNDMGYQHQGWPYDCPESSARCTCMKEGAAVGFHDGRERWFDAPEP